MKNIALSAMVIGLIGSANVQAAEDLSTMFSEGKTSGQIREFSVSRTVKRSAADDYTRNANAVGGHLKFETADYHGLSLGTTFYTTNGFANGDKTDGTEVDPSLLGPNNQDYSILGEAYFQYKRGNTVFKGGRQKLDTPLAGSDDARMLPNLFEAYLVINSDVENTTLIAGHVTKFAQGTFGRVYGAGGILGATSGYSAVDASNQVGTFVNMGKYALGESTDGVSVAAASYKNGNFKAQVWDYYAHDILNAIYADASVSWKCLVSDAVKPSLSVQVIKESAIGDELAGNVDSLYYAAKFAASVGDFTGYIAYSKQSEADAGESVQKSTITPWGGMPAYTQGMVTRHMFLAGTTATKAAAIYNFKDLGLKAVGYYASFSMEDNNGYTNDDASEAGFDFIYNTQFAKNLQLRFRGNFPTDFNVNATGDTVGWNEYRFIANYNF